MSTKSHLWSLTWATWIQSTFYHHTALISTLYFNSILRSTLKTSKLPFSFRLCYQNLECTSILSHACNVHNQAVTKSSPLQLYITFEPSSSRVHIPVQCLLKSLFRPFACLTSVSFIVFLNNADVTECPAGYRLSMRQRCCGQGHDKMDIPHINFGITT